MTRPQNTTAWRTLQALADSQQSRSPKATEALPPTRSDLVSACGISLDFTRQSLTTDALASFGEFAAAIGLAEKSAALVAGRVMNVTEQRPVLHTLLRQPPERGTLPEDIREPLEKVKKWVEAIRVGHAEARSLADHRYTDVLVIGIGGSALGPELAVRALTRFADGPRIHFLSNIDGAAFDDLTAPLLPLTTLVVVISKTFTTEETTINAAAARAWLEAGAGAGAFPAQFAAITAAPEQAQRQGYLLAATFTFPVGVGGRFSMWSAVGLPIALATGFANFRAMLDGAAAMDQHFATAPFISNLPMLLAAYGVWNRNFKGIASHAVLPYAQRLALLPKHLQQLEMESNGKSVDLDGNRIDYATCPVIFGEAGTNGQHSFHQLLHQGTDIISSDIIIVREREGRSASKHERLLANAFAQADAFWFGNHDDNLPLYRVHAGGRPVAVIELERLDAFHLGALIALYEHKVFAQGVMWHLNSFDQWGVELGKTIAKTLLPRVSSAPADGPISRHFIAAK
ncbi:MAG: glucose-6-phosphate isomerase [Aeromicrobium sp.]|nr:glucose-6-phosphate isomerase [Burkholderiales bacterium]